MITGDEKTLMLATKFREAYEVRTQLRDPQIPQKQQELQKKSKGFNEVGICPTTLTS